MKLEKIEDVAEMIELIESVKEMDKTPKNKIKINNLMEIISVDGYEYTLKMTKDIVAFKNYISILTRKDLLNHSKYPEYDVENKEEYIKDLKFRRNLNFFKWSTIEKLSIDEINSIIETFSKYVDLFRCTLIKIKKESLSEDVDTILINDSEMFYIENIISYSKSKILIEKHKLEKKYEFLDKIIINSK